MTDIDLKKLAEDREYWDECGAPKGTTQYQIGGKFPWEKRTKDGHYYWQKGRWIKFEEVYQDESTIPRPPKKAQEVDARPLSDDHLVRRIGELGNQLHNLGCDLQNNKVLSDELGQIACRLWDIAKQESARTKKQRMRDELVELMEAERENYFPKSVTAEQIADSILSRYKLEPKP